MTYDTEVLKPVRRHFTAVEIDLPRCSLTYGTAPCTAILGYTGFSKCYNTKATCQSKSNFTQGSTPRTTTVRFVDQEVVQYTTTAVVQRACLKSVSFIPGKIDLAGASLGQRSGVTVELFDLTGDDILLDDYSSERRGNFTTGWLLAKLVARVRYFAGIPLRVVQGFINQYGQVDTSSLQVRTYIVDRVTGPDGSGKITIVAKDPLRNLAKERAKYPLATKSALTVAATAVATTLVVDTTADLSTSGFVRVESEIIQYSGKTATTLTGCTRGVAGSSAATHDVTQNLQQAIKFTATNAVDVIYAILLGTDINPDYMDLTEWHDVCDPWIEPTAITAYVVEPSDPDKLLVEICEAWMLVVYWDDVAAKVMVQPVRPSATNEVIPITEEQILAGKLTTSEKTDQRINEIWFSYRVKNWGENIDAGNLQYLYIQVDTDAQSASEYNDVRPRQIYSRWLDDVSTAQANSTSTRYLLRFRDPPRRYEFSLDAASRVRLGSFISVTVSHIQDFNGNPITRMMRVVECAPVAGAFVLAVKAEEDFFQGRYGLITEDDADDYTGDPIEDAGDGFFCGDYDIMPDGTPPYLFA